ncbi:MAG: hypothetical protein JSS70_10255 [Bacteroidetes bacterium]|nr:hypothetical protein [Bacteroidota bacterium]
MKMNKFFLLVMFFAGIGFSALAQPYQKGIGLRISPGSYYDIAAASYKFFISDPGAIELNLGFGLKSYYYYNGTLNSSHAKPFAPSVSASYQHHFEIPVRGGGLYWFIGGGLVGYSAISSATDADGHKIYEGFGFGLFPTGGVDFKIPRIPLAVSADYRPTFFVTAPNYYDGFYGTNFGVSARYTIGER